MNYMLPTDADTIELIAKAIAQNRMRLESDHALVKMTGMSINDHARLEEAFDRIFNTLWSQNDPVSIRQKEDYREDARAAISALNLKLLTSTI